jgi:periplasmic protein TorT
MNPLPGRRWRRWLAFTGFAVVGVMLATGGSGAALSSPAADRHAAAACSSGQKDALKNRAESYKGNGRIVTGVGPTTFKVRRAACEWFVGVSLPHFKDPYWIANAYGIIQEAKRLGVKVRVLAATGYGDIATQLRQVDNFRTQGVNGLVLGSVDTKGMGPVVNQAWEDGIPVVYDNVVADSELNLGMYTDDKNAGAKQADYIAKKDRNARVIAFCGPSGAAWAKARCDGFVSRLKKLAPKAKVLALKYHDMDRAVIGQIAGNTLEAFPNATWVYNSTDLQAKGVIDALRAKGKRPGQIKITTLTIGRELFRLMRQGWVTYALAERSVAQGAIALRHWVAFANRQQVPDVWRTSLPGFQSTPADIRRFRKTEAKWNWEPSGFKP